MSRMGYKQFGAFVLASVLAVTGFAAENANQSSAAARKEMEMLASKGITESLKVLQEQGAIYPFELLLEQKDQVRLVGYSGASEDKPAATEYAKVLIAEARSYADKHPELKAAAIFRMHSILGDKGQQIPGVWALVDHRSERPWIVFQPLVPSGKDRHYSLGDQIYQATDINLFEPVPEKN